MEMIWQLVYQTKHVIQQDILGLSQQTTAVQNVLRVIAEWESARHNVHLARFQQPQLQIKHIHATLIQTAQIRTAVDASAQNTATTEHAVTHHNNAKRQRQQRRH